MKEIVLQKRKVNFWRCVESLGDKEMPAFVKGKSYKEVKKSQYPLTLINEYGENHALDEDWKNRFFEFDKKKKEYFALI